MGLDEYKAIVEKISQLDPSQKGTFVTWLIITLIRDVAYYAAIVILAIALGRRLIQAILIAYRESQRQHA